MNLGVAIAGAVVVLGLGQVPHRKGRATMMHLGSGSAGQQVTAHVGERLELVLPETGTTGYRWHLSSPCVELLTTEADESQPGDVKRPGALGEHRWVFLAKAAGQCELSVESARSWEPAGVGKVLRFPIVVVSGT